MAISTTPGWSRDGPRRRDHFKSRRIRLTAGGKFSLFANIFRCELLQQVPSIFIDAASIA